MKKLWIKVCCFLVMFCVALGPTSLTWAQTNTTGSIVGQVYDTVPTSPIPNATVTAKNEGTGIQTAERTDRDGKYTLRLLPPGNYTITASAPDYESSSFTGLEVLMTQVTPLKAPPFSLKKVGAPPTTATAQPSASEGGAVIVNLVNATRGGNFNTSQLLSLPLPGVRTFDDLAFLLPGVAPPPLAIGTTVGPGIGAGVGTSGQFSVNGLRSRSNNFTIDGSDNNDEDVGVRRQGFTALVPQSIESLQEYHVSTLLPEPQYGRNMGAQVDAVSRSGGTSYHGTLYGFLTDKRLKARDKFDFEGGPANFTMTSNGRTVLLNNAPFVVPNPVGDENPYTRAQYGFVFGGPVVKDKTYFFTSFEHIDINASRESHFAVPTVADRGFLGLGDKGLTVTDENGTEKGVTAPTTLNGDAFLSLFPFPNNPSGPYGNNTFSEILPASADGAIFSGRLDHQLHAFGNDHTLSGRYNFTNDNTTLPVTGEALFSTLRAHVRTQNVSIILSSPISLRTANNARFSFGRTHLSFNEVRDPLLLSSRILPNVPFLLNRPLVENITLPGGPPRFVSSGRDTETLGTGKFDFSNGTGPLGEELVSGFSPVGVDVFNFPQGRTDNTFQYADTLLYSTGRHKLAMGFDIRNTHLDSFLDRNSRVIALFTAAADRSDNKLSQKLPGNGAPNSLGFYLGRDFAAAGTPGGYYQTQKLVDDTTIRLRYWQNDFFFSDQFHISPNFTLTIGMRYELNTVPTEKDRRIESTFTDPEVQKFIQLEKAMTAGGVSGLEQFLAGRTKIYERDNNNIAPHVAFAWDPFGDGRTSIRAGYGIYYDQILGAVVSQSRTVYPNFFTVNCAGTINGGLGTDLMGTGGFSAGYTNCGILAKTGTLNTFEPGTIPFINAQFLKRNPPVNLNLKTISDLLILLASSNTGAGPGFTLPNADLVTPYAQHWGLTLEREIAKGYLVSAGYVGTRGVHLLRFATPNGGLNAIPRIDQIGVGQSSIKSGPVPIFAGSGTNNNTIPETREKKFPLLGSFTSIDSDASSNYHSLQLQLLKRFKGSLQFTASYTWSHAIDDVSDVFDLAGARALPQDGDNLRAERGDANFDVRHRFVYSAVWDMPFMKENKVLGGWQVASIGTFHTGQPYSLLNCCDANKDGNLTDRVGVRNGFRARGIDTVDVALNKNFKFSEQRKLEFRTEVFNLFNRTNYGIPVHQLFFGGFGLSPLTEKNHFVDTVTPARTVQFALKYSF